MKFYRARIEDHMSPLKDGRVRVRITGIHDETIPISDLPWAEVMQSLFLGYGSGIGVTSIPRTGTWVFVILDHDDENKPIVVSAIHGKAVKMTEFQLPLAEELNKYDPNKLALPEYPDNHVIESYSHHIIEIDDYPGNERIKIKHRTGTYIEMLPDGSMTINVVKDLKILVAGTSLFDTQLDSVIKGNDIHLNP